MSIMSNLTNIVQNNSKQAAEKIHSVRNTPATKARQSSPQAYAKALSATAISDKYDQGAYKVSLSKEALAKAAKQ